MKIRSHSESHIVELNDGSRWQIFPGDLDLTLNWKPETDLAVVRIDDEVSSHALVGEGGKVRVIPAGESWPVLEVRSVLKDGWCRSRPWANYLVGGFLQPHRSTSDTAPAPWSCCLERRTRASGRNLAQIWQPREPEPWTINEKTIADFTRVVEQTGSLEPAVSKPAAGPPADASA
jgi:hypothetical protein